MLNKTWDNENFPGGATKRECVILLNEQWPGGKQNQERHCVLCRLGVNHVLICLQTVRQNQNKTLQIINSSQVVCKHQLSDKNCLQCTVS